MFPLQDLNPTRRFPLLTFVLIGINVLVFIWELGLTEAQLAQAFLDLAIVPANISDNPLSLESFLDVVRSMFLHGGYEHIFGNMLYLYLFGDNLEDRCGRVLFLLLYFVSGFAAAGLQILIDPTSPIPMIGASGAVAGVLGGYLILFPTVRVRGVIPIGFIPFFTEWPAFIVLGLWFVLQLFSGFASLGVPYQEGGGVAFFAHIGGFVAGAAIILLMTVFMPQPPVRQRETMLYERAQRYRW
ncbi:MAG: rhomboid family intramembrane serine protease [Anaerolineae bacterium]